MAAFGVWGEDTQVLPYKTIVPCVGADLCVRPLPKQGFSPAAFGARRAMMEEPA